MENARRIESLVNGIATLPVGEDRLLEWVEPIPREVKYIPPNFGVREVSLPINYECVLNQLYLDVAETIKMKYKVIILDIKFVAGKLPRWRRCPDDQHILYMFKKQQFNYQFFEGKKKPFALISIDILQDPRFTPPLAYRVLCCFESDYGFLAAKYKLMHTVGLGGPMPETEEFQFGTK